MNKMGNTTHFVPHFGDIIFADLPYDGSVQGGKRPVLVVQNDKGNEHSSTVEVIPLSSKIYKGLNMPTHVYIAPTPRNGLRRASVILSENVLTIPVSRLIAIIGVIDAETLKQVGHARRIQSPLPY